MIRPRGKVKIQSDIKPPSGDLQERRKTYSEMFDKIPQCVLSHFLVQKYKYSKNCSEQIKLPWENY